LPKCFSDELWSDRHAGCGSIHGISCPTAPPPPTSPEAPLDSAQTQQLHKQVVFPENYINNGVESGNGLAQLRDLGPME